MTLAWSHAVRSGKESAFQEDLDPSNPNISHGHSLLCGIIRYQMYLCDEAGLGED